MNITNRQVDVKALVSHIVRGDGADKCRICMGDTTEGQVYLEDTVMVDGEKPVSLAELLEIITGVEVPLDEDLPTGLCLVCSDSAMAAAAFRRFCQEAVNHWTSTLHLLDNLPTPESFVDKKSIYLVLTDNQMTIIDDIDSPNQYPDEKDIQPEQLLIPVKKTKRQKLKKHNCQCPECGKKFKYAKLLHEHLMESSDYKRCCHICAAIMPRDELVSHVKDTHKQNLYDCKKCSAILPSLKQLKRHVVVAHAPGAYVCGDCGRTFQSPHAFHGHTLVHASKTCPSCNKLFRNHRCYLHHVKNCCNLDITRHDVKSNNKRVVFEIKNEKYKKNIKVGIRGSAHTECFCDYCGKKFASKKFVSAHIQIVHTKDTHRPCPYCGKSFAAAHMTIHLKKHEDTEKNVFTCEQCGIVLKTKLGYIQHLRLHTGERPYACNYCSETFSASSRRSEHIRKMHKNSDEIILKHVCEFCPAKFRLPYKLKKHVATVHGHLNTHNMEYECPDCHIKFGSCRGLLHHSRKHQTFKLGALKRSSRGVPSN